MMIVAGVVCRAEAFGFQIAVALAHDADPVAATGQQLPVSGVILDVAAAIGLMAAAGLELVAALAVDGFEREIGGEGGESHGCQWQWRRSPPMPIL